MTLDAIFCCMGEAGSPAQGHGWRPPSMSCLFFAISPDILHHDMPDYKGLSCSSAILVIQIRPSFRDMRAEAWLKKIGRAHV